MFVAETDEMCLCSLAFENLGLEFVEEYTPFDGNYGNSSEDVQHSSDNANRKKTGDGLPPTRVYQPPLLEWLEAGQCGHVATRAAADVAARGCGEDDDEYYESEDDLASDLDLEIYGVRISPQRAVADEELDYEETRALLEHSRRIKQYEVPTPPDPLPVSAPQPPTPKHETQHTVRDVTDSMNNLLISESQDGSEEVTPDSEHPRTEQDSNKEDSEKLEKDNEVKHGTYEENCDVDYPTDDAVFAEVLQAQQSTSTEEGNNTSQTILKSYKYPYFRELESLGSEDGMGSDFFLTEMKQASVNPIHVAAAKGHGDVINYLVTSLSCDVNEGTLGSEDTPLHIAARWGHTDTVRLLLRLDADPHRLNTMGYSALHLAIGECDDNHNIYL